MTENAGAGVDDGRSGLTVDFEIVGVTVRLRGLPAGTQPFLAEHYPGFHRLGSEEAATLVVDCLVEPADAILPLPAPGEPPPVEVFRDELGALATRGNWHEAALDLASGTGRLRIVSREASPFRMSLENFLRVAFANLLLPRDACLVHAAALVTDDGLADVFFGLSGSGKSRLVRLCPERKALSDDLVALRLAGDGGLLVERVPFHGEFPSTWREAGSFRVRHLLRLQRGSAHELRRIPRALQAARLRACLPFLEAADARVLDLASRLVAAHPAFELEFADDPGFRRLLD